MHELSLAIRIVEIATGEALKAGAGKVTDLDIEVGTLSGVMIDALELAMKDAVRDSMLEHACINILEIRPKACCVRCNNEFEAEDWFDICPSCHSTEIKFLQGQELQVKSLTVQ